jgi:hypothetical protein
MFTRNKTLRQIDKLNQFVQNAIQPLFYKFKHGLFGIWL